MTVRSRSIEVRSATDLDYESIWKIFSSIVTSGETYPFDPDTTKKQAYKIWMQDPAATFVALRNDEILGTYYIKPNQPALGAHVCNCGYMVSERARGQGIATQMCEHSQEIAVELGFKAMQFNLVVTTNEGAVRLWQRLGFDIVGTIPKAFDHRQLGFVDAYVMYKWLES
jgi:ribosomal protein S18 acetylase RimI-like enzyme